MRGPISEIERRAARPTSSSSATHQGHPTSELTPEQQILILVRKTLTAIVKDVTPPPGMRHPLSDPTITQIRDCLGAIARREKKLASAQGRACEQPYYADQPQSAQIVPIDSLRSRRS